MATDCAIKIMAEIMAIVSLWSIDKTLYTPHWLHGKDRIWPETNCYVDLWIEVLSAISADPLPCMAFTLGIDFEGDQWTFFKPCLGDLHALYGIEVQELTIFRPLPQQIEEQIKRGRLVLVEVDAFFLPDVAGVSYKIEHAKTTIAVQEIDTSTQGKHLGYFHNAGYYTLDGDDFDGLFSAASAALPPYVEFVKFDGFQNHSASATRSGRATLDRSVTLLKSYLERRPNTNPFLSYKERFGEDMEGLSREGLDSFHRYAFATLRQVGAACEISADYLDWISQQGGANTGDTTPARGTTPANGAASDLRAVSTSAKALQFKIARAVNLKKQPDASLIQTMASSWESAMQKLKQQYTGC